MSPPEELRFLILGAQREGNRILADRVSPLGLTPAQAEVIRCLSDGPPMSLGALGKLLVCETGSPSRLVDTLVGRGIVVRRENPADRRQVTLELSPEGIRLSDEIRKIETELYGFISQLMDEDSLTRVLPVLRRLVDGTTSGDAIARRKAR